jgi:hypothetical protein
MLKLLLHPASSSFISDDVPTQNNCVNTNKLRTRPLLKLDTPIM